MLVEKVNEWLYWTFASYDRFPVLVVLEDAPENQKEFARAFERLGMWRVIFG